jgi:ubiquinone/menaquinone biosynthesis C-methylase UbiE
MSQKEQWEKVYGEKPLEELGWYKPHLQTSLDWIKDLGLKKDAPIVDVGGGGSTLVDDLLNEGFQAITVLDISEKGLYSAKKRLGAKADRVTWLVADISSADLPENHFELWHDRAVFHFLTADEEQQKYRDNFQKAVNYSPCWRPAC